MIYIILPVKNEAKTIEVTIQRLNQCFPIEHKEHKIIFVNDHSTDNTASIIKSHKEVFLLNNINNPGKGSAIKFALQTIYVKNMLDIVVFLDGDGQIQPYDIFTGIKMMDLYCCSVAVGNKRHRYSISKYNFLRTVISKTYNFLVRKLFGLKIQDTQCGLKMFRSHCLIDVLPQLSIDGFAYDVELLVALKSIGMRIVDFPIDMNRQTNKGSISIKNIICTFIDTVKMYKKFVLKK